MSGKRNIIKIHEFIIIFLIIALIIVVLSNVGISAHPSVLGDKPKIHKELYEKIQNKPDEKIPVLIHLKKEEDLDKIADLINKEEGTVIGKFKAGVLLLQIFLPVDWKRLQSRTLLRAYGQTGNIMHF